MSSLDELCSWKFTLTTVSDLRVGDTVFLGGVLLTVGRSNLRYDPFLGWTFNGSLFPKGITKALPPNTTGF